MDWDTLMRNADDPEAGDARPLAQRLGWMVAIWAISIAFLGVIAYAIRWWLGM